MLEAPASRPFPVERDDLCRTAFEVPVSALVPEPAFGRLRYDDLRPDPILTVFDRRGFARFLTSYRADFSVDDFRHAQTADVAIQLIAHLLLPHTQEPVDQDGKQMCRAPRLPRHDARQRLD